MYQIQVFDNEWVNATKNIDSEELQLEIKEALLTRDKILGDYAPLYRMRTSDNSWFYFSANPLFNIVDGKLIEED